GRGIRAKEKPEDDEYIEAEADPEWKEREAGENTGGAVDTQSVGAALCDAMQHGGRNQEPDGHYHQNKCEAAAVSRGRRKLPKALLKGPVELETEQNLGSENEQPVFVERGLYLTAQAHGIALNA